MLVIRFKRIGKKNKPTYRIVAAEHSMPVSGKFVEDLGFYNPHTKASGLKSELILAWLKKGAKPSNSVAKLLSREKLKHSSIVIIKKNKKAKTKEETKVQSTPSVAPAETSNQETLPVTESAEIIDAPSNENVVENTPEETSENA